ncbi:hypothetical protein CO051_00380 [Candidatus Roizmanbacteria bacterium CG_4_9_14_0_2_um_filter_39_13]|uniref:Uncharacterized protein n=1 Tax=Candidatus Roizmanbacteria bacterium CG_4_9_14_0_2_um_filter_39_13 TaxID=1974839 RepID=A0A2M8F4F4_9BACT|nr:MAG: hypothetical protein CO051_00380 [Candidatus Roizmanbacteria bacterium CG_4_9_14_0_2_um_filter_39_13]
MIGGNKVAKRGASLGTPIRYCVFVQDNQEQSLEKLNNLHDKSEKRINDLKTLINTFVKDNKKNRDITNLPYMENLLDSLRQVEYSFSEFMEAEKCLQSNIVNNDGQLNYYLEKKTAAVLIFFFNARSFMKIVERYTNILQDIQFKQLLKDTTIIRDHFAHSYEKDISVGSYSKAFSSFQVQTGLSLESLVLTDLTTSSQVGRIWFSLPTFYFSLRDIFKELKDEPKLFNKQGKFNTVN